MGVQYMYISASETDRKLIVNAAPPCVRVLCMNVKGGFYIQCTHALHFKQTKTKVKVRFYGVSKGNLHCGYTLLMHFTGCTGTVYMYMYMYM